MEHLLERAVRRSPGWIEARFQERRSLVLTIHQGHVDQCSSSRTSGVGIRVLADGAFGFASTTDLTEQGLARAVASAQSLASSAARGKKRPPVRLAPSGAVRGTFPVETRDPLDGHPLEEKIDLVLRLDQQVRASPQITSSSVTYEETIEERLLATAGGTLVRIFDMKPSLRVLAVASANGASSMGLQTAGVTGGWADLFARRRPDEMVEEAVRLAMDQLSAPHAPGGPAAVVLDPELVGILCHEAIGHTVEADIVLGGAITAERLGTRIGSELVTMYDSGLPPGAPHVVGRLPVDDEGVRGGQTVLIERGVLRSFLHNRETAALFGAAPTGNARAYQFSDEPIIRMTNTYLESGDTPLDALLAGAEGGYYLRGFSMSGQADSSGEFMFGVREAHRIERGKPGHMLRGVTISGNAFRVLESVDAVANDFAWEHSADFCGKGQPAKVDCGGPHVRCRVTLGGRQP